MSDDKKKVHDIRTGTELPEDEKLSPDEEKHIEERQRIKRWIQASKKRTV